MMPTVILYFPSTGTLITHQDWCWIQGIYGQKGCCCKIMDWLPQTFTNVAITSLHFRKSDGMPDSYGQLQKFTDV